MTGHRLRRQHRRRPALRVLRPGALARGPRHGRGRHRTAGLAGRHAAAHPAAVLSRQRILRSFAGALAESLRETDMVARISPNEFGQFIGDDIRLLKVTVDNVHIVPEMLDFFMGKNTPERRQYIMERLV